MSPDGRNVALSATTTYGLSTLLMERHAITQGGTEEVRKGELDWVYPESWTSRPRTGGLRIPRDRLSPNGNRTESLAVPDGSSPSGDAVMGALSYGAGGPIRRSRFCGSPNGGETWGGWTPERKPTSTFRRVNWLTDVQPSRIQRLNRTPNHARSAVAEAATSRSDRRSSESNWSSRERGRSCLWRASAISRRACLRAIEPLDAQMFGVGEPSYARGYVDVGFRSRVHRPRFPTGLARPQKRERWMGPPAVG